MPGEDDGDDGERPPSRRRRRLAALGLLGVMLALAGCSTVFGPGPVQEGQLAQDPPDDGYEWDADADGYLEVNKNNYTAVYRVANRTTGSTEQGENFTMELYTRDALGTDQPLDPTALQFRYENGTRLRYVEADEGGAELVAVAPDGSQQDVPEERLAVEKDRRRTTVTIPTNESGRLAFVAPKNGKQVSSPTFVAGSYEMVLPAEAAIGLPVLAQVQPDRDSAERVDGRVHVRWDDVQRANTVLVRYYLQRDLLLFGGLAALMLVAGAGGAVYYYIQIRETVKRREEVGLDVDVEDDDRDPPPGMG